MTVMNVAIVSDNYDLMKFIQSLVSQEAFKDIRFEYKFTRLNNDSEPFKSLGATVIDMKSRDDITDMKAQFDCIISLHCKQIFPAELVRNVRCVNVHPGLNPYNRGWFPQVFSIINKLPLGATIHYMDEQIDHGNILFQQKVELSETDTSLTAYQKVILAEKEMLTQYFAEILSGNCSEEMPGNEGNYNSIGDFNKLCRLDLSHEGTLGEHIDLLRALTHGEFKNAYFYNKKGEKVFVKVALSENK